MSALSIGYTEWNGRWIRPLPPDAPVGILDGIADGIRPLWDILRPGDTAISFAGWYDGLPMDPLEFDSYAEVKLAGKGPEALVEAAVEGLGRAQAAAGAAEVGWEFAGPVFPVAARVVVPQDAELTGTLPVWVRDWQSMSTCRVEEGEPWRGLRTVWVHLPDDAGRGCWRIAATQNRDFQLDVELTLNVWLDSDPPVCGPILAGVALTEWRRLNQAFLAEVLARLEERWRPPRWAPPW